MSRKKKSGQAEGRNITYDIINRLVIERSGAFRAAGIEPSPSLASAIAAYCQLLLRWNEKINLTAITDLEEILTRNFIECFQGARWLEAEAGSLCDVGSGAGFPGLALKLARPGWTVRLFEPNLKKAAFLAEVSRQINLHKVEIVRERWEDASVADSSADVVTARAVGGYREIATKAHRVLRGAGKLLLWVAAEEGGKLRGSPGWKWEVERLPESRERILLVGTRLDEKRP
jgi:16S rRNA (guanine(527)-N(7))-methyltransferase RsmG